jgi:DNA-binding NarL/FixJ family response regulator
MSSHGAAQRKARILIVDDHAIVRHGMAQLASQELDAEVCYEADNAEAALALLQEHDLDLAIVDASLAGVSGLELVARIRQTQPKLPVLLLALLDDSLSLERALRAGANGYVLKQDPTETLVAAMRKVIGGGVFLSEKMQQVVLQHYLSGARGGTSIVNALSPREFEVFQLIGQGLGTSQIAAKLARSVKTIEAHRATIKQKLGLKSGIELTQFAARWSRQRE